MVALALDIGIAIYYPNRSAIKIMHRFTVIHHPVAIKCAF